MVAAPGAVAYRFEQRQMIENSNFVGAFNKDGKDIEDIAPLVSRDTALRLSKPANRSRTRRGIRTAHGGRHPLTEFEIVPYVRFGPVEFGMSRPEVAEALGPPDVIRGSDMSYHYRRLGTVGFHEEGRCDWVGSGPELVTAIVDDMRLTGSFDTIVGQRRI